MRGHVGGEILRPIPDRAPKLDYHGATALATEAAELEPADAGIRLRGALIEKEGGHDAFDFAVIVGTIGTGTG